MPHWRFYTVHFAIALLGLAVSSTRIGQQPPSSSEHIPPGWFVYPDSKLKHADETTLRCFNFSHNEWHVSIKADYVQITKWSGRKFDVPSLPPLLKVQPGMPGKTVSAGLSGAMHFAKGWLLAYDAGEFGGGLWLTNEDGSEAKRILGDNVLAIVPLDGGGFLVLSGLAHLSMDFGNLFIFSNPEDMNIALQYSAHLDGAPTAYTKLTDGSVLFLTTLSLNSIAVKPRTSAELNYFFPHWMKMQYPNSMVALKDGTIFIGMRMFVLRLTPSTAGYKEDWLLPNSCRKFENSETDCVCRP
jgi:hypothetical protein